MKRSTCRWVAMLNIGLILFTGCHPTQPFFLAEDGDLSHYLNTATQIEYPDLEVDSLPEATQSMAPYVSGNDDYEFLDMGLEDCLSTGLANLKTIRSVPGSALQTGDIATVILSSPSQQLRTVYDPAITASTTNPQAMVVDQAGNRTLARGAARANQVGGVEDALSEFDAQYSSFFAHNTTDRPRNTGANIFTPNFFVARDTTYQSALSKRMATGGVVTARAQTIYSANNVPAPSQARAVESDFSQILEIQVQHPLMRGRGALVNRIPTVLARINEDISQSQYEEGIRNFTKEVEVAYWDLYCAYWAFETARSARDSALQVWRVANDKRKEQMGQSAGEPRALAQVHQFNRQLIATLNGSNIPGGDPGVKGRERRLRHLMGWAAIDGRLIRPTDRPTIARTEFDWPSIHSEMLNRNLDLRNSRFAIKQRELELISAKNQILPEVNASGNYRWVGVGDELFGSNGGANFPLGQTSAWEGITGGDFQEIGFRLEFTPNAYGQRRALATITNAKLQLARETEILREKEVNAVHLLSDAILLLDSHYSQMTEALNQIAALDREVKVQEDLYRADIQGSIDAILNELLRAQELRARAQQDYYRGVCEYNKSLVHIHLLKGSLLEYNGIEIQEGPWHEKAYWDATEQARARDAARHLPYGASRPAVISRGPVIQNQGTANSQATGPASSMGVPQANKLEPTPLSKENAEKDSSTKSGRDDQSEAESVPAVPEKKSTDNLELKEPTKAIGTGLRWNQATSATKPTEEASLQWNARAGQSRTNVSRISDSDAFMPRANAPVQPASFQPNPGAKPMPSNSLRR